MKTLKLTLGLTVALSTLVAPAALANKRAGVSDLALAGSGVKLYALQDGRLPRVWYHLYLEAGERFAPAAKAGLSSVAVEVLDRGPSDVPYDIYQRDNFRQGTEIRWEAGNRFLVAHVKCRPEQLVSATALVKRTALKPRLDTATFTEARSVVVNQRKTVDDDMRSLTFLYAKQRVWNFAPEARMPEGWVSSLAAVTAPDVQRYMAERLTHPSAFVAAATPLAPAALAKSLAPVLAGWVTPFSGQRTPMPGAAAIRRVILIDKPGATDNQIYMLTPAALDLSSPEAAATEVFFAGMGAGLGARLGKALRVERGLTYGANSGLRRVEWPNWYAYTFGGIEQTPKLLGGFFELFAAARTGLTDAEVAIAKDQLLQSHASEMESPPEQINAVAAAVAQGLPPETPFLRPSRIAAVTPEQVRGPALAAADLLGATIVVMGDASKLQASLKDVLPGDTPITVRKLSELAPEALGTLK